MNLPAIDQMVTNMLSLFSSAPRVKALFLAGGLCLLGWALPSIRAWQSDNSNGTFTNPPLYADYPDPDIIRVGEDFYFATTTFVNSPGLTILHSRDLVNWEIISHVVTQLKGRKEYDLQGGVAYRGGVFAPSLRFSQGTFYVVVTPNGQNTLIYRAMDIRGPWQVDDLGRSVFDPGFFIDDDRVGYIATSGGWDGTVTLLTLNAAYNQVVDERKIHFNPGAEGSKIVKRGEWYYMFHSIPRRLALTVSRAKKLTGPWTTIEQLDDRSGGHQGAIVDLPDRSWYGFVMKDQPGIGRMTNISPIFWADDWPVWGTPDAPLKVPSIAPKPIQGKPISQPATSDDFDNPLLGLQWQWNHNPDEKRWSLTTRPGFLRLAPTKSTGFWTARNTLTQKGQGPWSRGEVRLDLRSLKPGDTCGFGVLGKISGHIAANCGADGAVYLSMNVIEDGGTSESRVPLKPISSPDLFLRLDLDFVRNRAACSYSLDGSNWTVLGGAFELVYDWKLGTFQGPQFALFCFNAEPRDGFVDVDWFRFSDRNDLTQDLAP